MDTVIFFDKYLDTHLRCETCYAHVWVLKIGPDDNYKIELVNDFLWSNVTYTPNLHVPMVGDIWSHN